MISLLIGLQLLFWIPMIFRVAMRKTPEVTFQSELLPKWREPGLLLYQIGIPMTWIGFALAFTGGRLRITSTGIFLGAIFHVVATVLFGWAISVHQSWNVQARLEPDHALCTSGPYRIVRHPIYLAFDLLAVGSAVWAPHPLVIAGSALLIIGGELRARAEERVLDVRFGAVYRDYMRRVRRTIPGIY